MHEIVNKVDREKWWVLVINERSENNCILAGNHSQASRRSKFEDTNWRGVLYVLGVLFNKPFDLGYYKRLYYVIVWA